MAYGKVAKKGYKAQAPSPIRNRADAIDSVVNYAQKGGSERQSGYKRPR